MDHRCPPSRSANAGGGSVCRQPELTVHEHGWLADGSASRMARAPSGGLVTPNVAGYARQIRITDLTCK